MPRFHPEDVVGRFIIGEKLGRGGFGEAYKAQDTKLGRQVVVKCLRDDLLEVLGNDLALFEETRKRFSIEARAQARINHANVCTIFDVDEENEVIILEYIEGENLQERRDRGVLTRHEVADISLAIAEAVAEAHRLNVWHRDLTMKNIMISASNSVKVLDFGLAKLPDEPGVTNVSPPIGNLPYMPPEQQRAGGRVDARSDVFSIGVILYRLITNSFPYVHRFSDEPDPGLPPTFESFGYEQWLNFYMVVQKALQVDPADRYQSVRELLNDLVRVRNMLHRTDSRYAFFDTSTLLDVVRPVGPAGADADKRRRAQGQFEVSHAEGSAITSTSVIVELVTAIQFLYYEVGELGRHSDAGIQTVVDDAKREIQKASRTSRTVPWSSLSIEERRIFFNCTKSLFRQSLLSLTQQLALVETDVHETVSRFFEFADEYRLPHRDSWVLAEAVSAGSHTFYSEESRYGQLGYTSILKQVDGNLYFFNGVSPARTPPLREARAGGQSDNDPTQSMATVNRPL